MRQTSRGTYLHEIRGLKGVSVIRLLYSVASTATAADASSCLFSSVAVSGNKQEVLPSFHVTTMSPPLRSLASPLDGEDLFSCSTLSLGGSGSLAGDASSSSSPPHF